MDNKVPRVVIAALRGGSGKTTLSLGLIASWRQRAGDIVPFKKGPDYIDAGWLALAAGRPCYNLDPYMMNGEQILDSFAHRSFGSYGAVIEGNRGLFDGMDEAGSCSTAEVAKLLQAPVLLVVDGTKITRTAAALVLGCLKLDPHLSIRGVILNRVAGSRHERMLRSTIEHYAGVPVVGAIPRLRDNAFPERHMGLMTALEHPDAREAILARIHVVERYLDVERVIGFAGEAPMLEQPRSVSWKQSRTVACRQPVIGVIADSAFQFYYPENLEALQRCGARVIRISALQDRSVPKLDALYVGGGFPETHAAQLAANSGFRKSLKKVVHSGLPVYAECGGLMYLGRKLHLEGKTYPMVDVLPMDFELRKRPQAHGYTEMEVIAPNPFYPVGISLKGHEFHYSRVIHADPNKFSLVFRMRRGTGILDEMDGVCYKNVLATYSHVHAVGSPEWAEGLVQKALAFQQHRITREAKKNGREDESTRVFSSAEVPTYQNLRR
ncbi:MAG: hydrogenobyrinic acid a,c-diamide synthase (glutamine-hydrolyzing) [Deltaproteobacteria bacterium]|nr:hydrogenobyrinic acid a,c-diamide synthase (glutamine-hydrolyzing) [Deltaproteobacteria bacterium]